MSVSARRAAVGILLACGALLWVAIGNGRGMGAVRWVLFFAAIGIGAVPAIRVRVGAFLDRIRNPSPAAMEKTALLVGVVATVYFIFTAFYQDRDLFPKTHDEGSYLLGMQMLARGRLWMPQHSLADFFETFYVIVKPVYASLYFPGTALMFAPTIWLNWPTWVLPVVASGAVVGLLYWIVTRLLGDGAAGLLAALLMTSLSWFRMLTILLFSQVPMLLLGLLMVWAWLRWREHSRAGWLVAIGAFAGWAAITRPVDALAYAIAVGFGIAYDLSRRTRRRRSFAAAAGLLVAGAAPFFSLQLAFDKGVTGTALQSPYTSYLKADQPQTSFGFHAFDASSEPRSTLAQKRDYYRTFMRPMIERHRVSHVLRNWIGRDDAYRQKTHERPLLPMLVDSTMPFRILLPLAFVGVLGLTDVRRRALWATLPLLVIGYAPNTFFLEHYAVTIAPAVILSILLGVESLARAWPRWKDVIRSSFSLGIVTLALLSTYETNRLTTLLDRDDLSRRSHAIDDETFHSTMLQFVNLQLPEHVQKPAVVLFKYKTGDDVIREPVYNNAAAWPDDEAIVRAHDLGDRNVEIVRYYATLQPERTFYRFDRSTSTLTELGDAKSLLAKLLSSPTTSP